MQTTVQGRFVKIVFAADLDLVLERGLATRPPARYNRQGEDALYLSESESAARVALRKYVKADEPSRMLLTFEISPCQVFDLRATPPSTNAHGQAEDWQEVLAQGKAPQSWRIADQIRQDSFDGLLDPSRKDPTVNHLVLFRWNFEGAPSVRLIGSPKPVRLLGA